jgi:hypothetical protein
MGAGSTSAFVRHVGGVAISKFLFFILIVAGLLALIGLFTREA